MSDAAPSNGGQAFDALDPRLNVFALANGMDLSKTPESRRLEWFSEGLERGILIEQVPGGGYDVAVLCWKTGKTDSISSEGVAENASSDVVGSLLSDAIEKANSLTL